MIHAVFISLALVAIVLVSAYKLNEQEKMEVSDSTDCTDSNCCYISAKGDYHAKNSRYQPANDSWGTSCPGKRNKLTPREDKVTLAAQADLPSDPECYPFEKFYRSSEHYDPRFIIPTAYYKSRHIHETIPEPTPCPPTPLF